MSCTASIQHEICLICHLTCNNISPEQLYSSKGRFLFRRLLFLVFPVAGFAGCLLFLLSCTCCCHCWWCSCCCVRLLIFVVVVGVNVWWVYLAPQNIPRAISVLTLGNKVILYIVLNKLVMIQWLHGEYSIHYLST